MERLQPNCSGESIGRCHWRFESIDDTILQLFISQASVLIIGIERIQSEPSPGNIKEKEHENTNGADLARHPRQHWPQDRILA
jgi:hypothetical protein